MQCASCLTRSERAINRFGKSAGGKAKRKEPKEEPRRKSRADKMNGSRNQPPRKEAKPQVVQLEEAG